MIGTTISHYRVLSRLGAGGMGEVWLAEDIRLGHKVAVKFLLPHLAREREARARFLNEATAISQLQHQSIVPLLECDERDDQLFIITPYCPGGSLRDALKTRGRDGLPAELALGWGQSVAEGLAEAHSRGILHRDIKPENLLFNDRDELRICDFGLAKLVDATQITRTAATLGTAGYMSPEQVRGETADERSDIWSLGVVLYEMATGKRPFDRDNMQATLLAITTDEPAPVESLRADLPEELSWIVAKCLQKDPDARYGSARELADDLDAVGSAQREDGATVRLKAARPAAANRRPWNPAVVIAATILVVAAGVFWWQSRPSGDGAEGVPDSAVVEPQGPPRLIVAQIENRTGDSARDADLEFATERLAQKLATTDLVEVVPLAGVLTAMQGLDLESAGEMSEDALRALSEETGARVVVTGALFGSESRYQIQGRISEFPGGRIIAAIPAIETDASRLEAAMLDFEQRAMGGVAMYADNLFRQPLPAIPPRFDAYAAYAEGRDGFDRDWGQLFKFEENMEPFLRAVEMDSTFGRPAITALLIADTFNGPGLATALLDQVKAAGLEFDEYESLLLEFVEHSIAARRTESLGFAQRLHESYPEDVVSGILLYAAYANNGFPARAIEVFNSVAMPVGLDRRLFGAMQLRILSGLYHVTGDYQGEARTLDRMTAVYPNLLLFNLNPATPYAAMGDSARVREIVTSVLGQPGSRGQFDYMVWSICDVFSGHDHPEMGVELAEFYLAQRTDEGWDTPLRNNKAALLCRAERWDEARMVFESAVADSIQASVARLQLALLAARRGDAEFVQQVIDDIIAPWQQEPDEQGAALLWRARIAALSGELDEAVRWLREASRKGQAPAEGWRHDPNLYPLFGYAPFEDMIRPRG